MTLSMALFTFFNAFWIAMFIAVLFGRVYEGEKLVGIRWRKTLVLATLLAMVFTAALALMIKMQLVPLHDMQF